MQDSVANTSLLTLPYTLLNYVERSLRCIPELLTLEWTMNGREKKKYAPPTMAKLIILDLW